MEKRTVDPRSATPWAVLGIVAVLIGGAYFRFASGAPVGIDEWWHGVTATERGSAPYAVAVFLAEVGGSIGAAACTAIVAALLLVLRMRRDAGAVVTAMILGVLASETIKAVVLRTRPWDALYPTHGTSYPSGHSMGAAALAVSILLAVAGSERVSDRALAWTRVAAATWILTMMWSRAALHAHWLSDTIAGAVLGAAVAVLARRLWIRPAPPAATLNA